jgi:hypothetical protein
VIQTKKQTGTDELADIFGKLKTIEVNVVAKKNDILAFAPFKRAPALITVEN